ncbi:DUF6705 family protein [Flavobacterium lacus]|uniref:DUF6705 domain-containing protein n=1 Tax=Flavobacterium lacus TaxID=1353778 RepID=A0A328WZ17_9FLAO|nr:DUF6705 family protein [Flavobacterium lacus]RAR48099.1 hypothetical protein B0I10_106101 [Flavobacterium lacus]
MNKLTILLTFFCKITFAQTPILPLYDSSKTIQGAYYKDLQQDFNRFVGEWKYEQGSTELIVRIQIKEEQFVDYGNISVYEDYLVAEYHYVENGVEKINTLPNLLINHPDPYDYSIKCNIIIKPVSTNPDVCPNCGPNDVMVKGPFSDPEIEILGYEPMVVFRHKIENGVEKIFLTFRIFGNLLPDFDGVYGPHTTYNLPEGRYELIKQ